MTFEGKRILITGAARGIGLATAERFARGGAAVALVDCDPLEEVVAGLTRKGGRARAIIADVGNSNDATRAAQEALAWAGGLDVLVNNAGMHFARRIDDYTAEEFDRLLHVNFRSAFDFIRATLPALRTSRGTIVSVSSMTGLVGQDRGSVYSATKGALVSMTKSLAIELAPDGIRVNCVCPAGVDTLLLRNWAETMPDPIATLRQQNETHLIGRMAAPAEIADAIVFLASPAAAFITGIALPVEGGATLGYRR
jgi:NAD(P)-dependent dehydrogenase (short-subunit alcohol dehydrogenase family)